MSKALLIMDMPKNCLSCLECDSVEWELWVRHYCIQKAKEIVNIKTKPVWCPLIPEPEKHAIYDDKQDYSADYYHGWNACIDTLEGKENGTE